jgi:uncharacterized protein (TIGR03437 family)
MDRISPTQTLPKALAGVSVRINGKDCFVSYVRFDQINVLTPPDSTSGPVDVDVFTSHGTAAVTASMASVSPGLFMYSLLDQARAVAFFNADGAYVAAVGVIPGGISRPAKPGDYILFYATGLGATNPAYPIGQVLTKAYPLFDPAQVHFSIGGHAANVQFVGMTFPGVFQVNVQIPDGIGSGDVPVILQIGQQSSQENVVLAVDQ